MDEAVKTIVAHVTTAGIAGAGKLIDNLGTTHGSRVLQLYNGRGETSFISSGGCTIGVTAEGLPAGFLNLS